MSTTTQTTQAQEAAHSAIRCALLLEEMHNRYGKKSPQVDAAYELLTANLATFYRFVNPGTYNLMHNLLTAMGDLGVELRAAE